jgi:hypothetical protein
LVGTIAIVLGPIFILPFVYASDRDRRFMQVQYDQSSKASAIAALIFIVTMILVVWRGSWPNELGNLVAIYFIPVAGFGLGLLSVAEGGSYACTL